jgi:DNA-binding CsgD family transcriptional regulator
VAAPSWISLEGCVAESTPVTDAETPTSNGANGDQEAARPSIDLKVVAEGNWASAGQRTAVLAAFQTLLDSPEFQERACPREPGGRCTQVRGALIGKPGWNDVVGSLQRAQFGDFFVCLRLLRPQEWNLFVGLRPAQGEEFTPRELAIVNALLGAVEWLPAVVTAPLPLPDIAHLPHRVRVAFRHFRTGKSTKEIAEQMGISHHTVVDYFKRIYRHFGVSSGRELLALLLADGDSPSGDPERE